MLGRLGGAKEMLVALPPDWIRKVILAEQAAKHRNILPQIEAEQAKPAPDRKTLAFCNERLHMNKTRNLAAKEQMLTFLLLPASFVSFAIVMFCISTTRSPTTHRNATCTGRMRRELSVIILSFHSNHHA